MTVYTSSESWRFIIIISSYNIFGRNEQFSRSEASGKQTYYPHSGQMPYERNYMKHDILMEPERRCDLHLSPVAILSMKPNFYSQFRDALLSRETL
jgi:hypothetical protein